MKQTFLNRPEDCKWLMETHLKPINLKNGPVPEFKSFLLFGNEDCPTEIQLFFHKSPLVSDKPHRALLNDDGTYSILFA